MTELLQTTVGDIFISIHSPALLTALRSSSSKEEKSCFMIGQDLTPETLIGWHLRPGELMYGHPFALLLGSAHPADPPPLLGFLPPVGSGLGWISLFSLLFSSLPPLWPCGSGLLGMGQQLTGGPKGSRCVSHWSRPWLHRLHPEDSTDGALARRGNSFLSLVHLPRAVLCCHFSCWMQTSLGRKLQVGGLSYGARNSHSTQWTHTHTHILTYTHIYRDREKGRK